MTDQQTLENRFDENGLPRRLLYPLWYRLLRRLGFDVKPPVLLSLAGHYLYSGPTLVAGMILAIKLSQWLTGGPELNPEPIVAVSLLVPFSVWLRYQFIRRRIGLKSI